MAQQNRTTLKTYFNTGDTPTESQFIDLIDSSPNPTDDGTTGSGSYVRATSPTLVTPTLGAATATSVNKVAITAPATGATITPTDGTTTTLSGGAHSGTNTGDQTITLTGDVTGTGTGSFAATIANDAVTNAKLANMATQTIKGRTTAGTGDPEDLTATQATAILNEFTGDSGSGGVKGLVKAPAAGDAAAGKFLKADGTWTAPSGSGDVVGPVSATDSVPALFNGTTGKLIKNSTPTGTGNPVLQTSPSLVTPTLGVALATSIGINGTGGNGFIGLVGQSSPPPAPAAGESLFYAVTTQGFTRFEVENEGATNIVLTRDLVTIAKNTSGATITKGSVVYVTGSTGNIPNIAKAQANSSTTIPAIYIVIDDIANNAFGQIMRNGVLTNFDTSAFSTGASVWLSPTVAGGLTSTRPSGTTNYVQRIGTILSSGVNGSLDVSVAPEVLNTETGTNAATWTATDISVAKVTTSGNIELGNATDTTISRVSAGVVAIEGSNILTGASGANLFKRQMEFIIGDGTSVITTGEKKTARVQVPVSGTITDWVLLSLDDTSGSVTLDIWKDTYANYPPTVGDTITAAAKPSITTATKNASSTLTGWTTSITGGDIFSVNVDSVTSLKVIKLIIKYTVS